MGRYFISSDSITAHSQMKGRYIERAGPEKGRPLNKTPTTNNV